MNATPKCIFRGAEPAKLCIPISNECAADNGQSGNPEIAFSKAEHVIYLDGDKHGNSRTPNGLNRLAKVLELDVQTSLKHFHLN